MKHIITLFLCLIPLFAKAQDTKIIGGYLLDGNDSLEELEAAVLTDSNHKDKQLDGKGMRIPGGCIVMTPESIGGEIGTILQTKQPFLVKSISFTVDENRMDGCKANIRIYNKQDDGTLANIITMPIYQEIPKAEKKTTFHITPEECIELTPGEYYISFCLTEISEKILARWADSESWSEKERYTGHMQDRIFFPLYIKSSYIRESSEMPLTKWKYNIGISVRGMYLNN